MEGFENHEQITNHNLVHKSEVVSPPAPLQNLIILYISYIYNVNWFQSSDHDLKYIRLLWNFDTWFDT